MELSGYPHYENVCSNILRFYLDTSEPHGLKNLLLQSLLQCIGEDKLAKECITTSNVYREEPTQNKKRIDLVIEAESTIIAIENKIFHWLHNDLTEYSNHIHSKASNFSNKLFVVLSLKEENTNQSGFIAITYKKFFAYLKGNLGQYAVQANTRYLTYLIDFIESVENLYTKKTMNEELFNLLADNYKKIEELQAEYKKLNAELYDVVVAIGEKVPSKGDSVRKWIWDKWVLVHDIKLPDGITIALDCQVNFKTTHIEIFSRRSEDDWDYLKNFKIISNSEVSLRKTSRGYILYEKEEPFYQIDQESLAQTLNAMIDDLIIQFNAHV